MWTVLLAGMALAETPVALEVGGSLALPHAALGIAPGLRLIGEAEVADHIWVGAEGDARFPGHRKIDISDPTIMDHPVEVRANQTAIAIGARGAYMGGDPDGLQYRGALAIGATRLFQAIKSDAGKSVEAASGLWIRPQGGVAFAVGPGAVTADLYWSIATPHLDAIDGGGSVVGLAIGWRQPL